MSDSLRKGLEALFDESIKFENDEQRDELVEATIVLLVLNLNELHPDTNELVN